MTDGSDLLRSSIPKLWA